MREGMKGVGVLNVPSRADLSAQTAVMEGGGHWMPRVPDISKQVLLNHLSQPFGKVELGPW